MNTTRQDLGVGGLYMGAPRVRGAAANLPDTRHHRYSLQLSIYARMLYSTYGLDVGNRLYILRMHADLSAPELVHCTDLRKIADEVLRDEYLNLLH